MSIDSLFQSALRRVRAPLEAPGAEAADRDGARAAFSVTISENEILFIEYRCTTCATLVACCEALRGAGLGAAPDRALEFTMEDLAAMAPGVPKARMSRLRVALDAFRGAIRAAMPPTGRTAAQNSNCAKNWT